MSAASTEVPPAGGAGGAGGAPLDPQMMLTPTKPSGPDTVEGGGTAPNANLPGNTDGPSESKPVAPTPSTGPQYQLTTKPRQEPSGGGTGPESSGAANDAAGGADQMDQDSGSTNAYSAKRRQIIAKILADNPGIPRERANMLASRILKSMPGLIREADQGQYDPYVVSGDPVERSRQNTPQKQPKQQGGGAGVPGVPGAAPAAGEGIAGAGAAEGLAELLPLAVV